MNPYDDAWGDPTVKVFVDHVIENLVPKIESSAFVISLVPTDRVGDVKFWVELGASIMQDKPIIAVAFSEDDIPDKLRLIADEIVVLPNGMNEDASGPIGDAIQRITSKLDG